jgi:adenosylhomocysteine nucleosidase
LDSDIGVVVGMAAEARLARRLGWHVALGGGTAPGAGLAARQLIDGGARALISFGLAGGLDPALRAGTVIVPSAIIDGHHRYPTDPSLSQLLGGATRHSMLATETPVASAAEKQRLHGETGAAAIDLESGAVARAAAAHGIPFAVLRVVCDPAQRSLPPAALAALDSHGAIAMRRVLASILIRPAQIPALLKLATEAAAARRSLLVHVRRIVPKSV